MWGDLCSFTLNTSLKSLTRFDVFLIHVGYLLCRNYTYFFNDLVHSESVLRVENVLCTRVLPEDSPREVGGPKSEGGPTTGSERGVGGDGTRTLVPNDQTNHSNRPLWPV